MLDDPDKPLQEREYPDASDLAGGEEDDQAPGKFILCRACGEPMYEKSPRCPHCGQWVVRLGQGWRESRKWYVRGGLYLTRMIVVNWLLWLVLGAIAGVAAIMELLR